MWGDGRKKGGEGGQYTPLPPSFIYTMEIANALIASQVRERALMVELETARIALSKAEGRESKALAEKEAANREKEAVTRERDAIRREREAVTREKEAVSLLVESLRGEKTAANLLVESLRGEKTAATLLAESLRGEKTAATLLAESLRREVEILRASSGGTTEEALQKFFKEDRERSRREEVEAKYRRDQRSLWLRSPDSVLNVLILTAQNGHSTAGFHNLSRAFRYSERLWDAIKDRCGRNGHTFLMEATYRGDVERVRWLLKRGANVNAARSSDGHTVLMWACGHGRLEIARMLIDKGANVNAARPIDGITALMCSSDRGHLEITRLLLSKKALVNVVSSQGFSALAVATTKGHAEVVRLLKDAGAKK